MADYGKYSCMDSIVAVYKCGKLQLIIENVNPETIFIHEDYNKEGLHELDFKRIENGIESSTTVKIYPINSFRIFPSWMAEKLREIL